MVNVEKISNPSNPASKGDQSPSYKIGLSGAIQVPVDRIRVRARYRKNSGAIDRLVESISKLGLLQPLVITADHQLVAERRLRAVRDVLKHVSNQQPRILKPSHALRALS